MTNDNKNVLNTEQIKKESTKIQNVFEKIKIFLEKDQYDYFNLKTKRKLDIRIKMSERKISSLVDLKLKSEKVLRELLNNRKKKIETNTKLQQNLLEKLNRG